MFQVVATVDEKHLNDVIFALQALGSNQLPATAQAVQISTSLVQRRWIDNTKGAFKRSIGTYLRGIMDGMQYPYENDVYRGAVINTAPHARWIEEGTPAHDLKKMLHTSMKVRVSAKGKKYLIIPFRHGTPSAGSHEGGRGEERATLQTMPHAVYQMAKHLVTSQRVGSHITQSPATGKPVIRHSYQWGRKLTQHDLNVAGVGTKRAHWKSSPYAGMVRFPRDEGPGHEYFTFRVMHEDSTGWLHPGTPPMWLARKTAQEMQPVVAMVIQKGFMKDMNTFLGHG